MDKPELEEAKEEEPEPLQIVQKVDPIQDADFCDQNDQIIESDPPFLPSLQSEHLSLLLSHEMTINMEREM